VIARGGMGVVYRGRDASLCRDLAVKVLLPGYRDRPDLVRRFVEEARVCGRLAHPGVVPVHELGRLGDGRPYFTMKLIEGQTLAALLEKRLHCGEDLPRFLAIFEQVCQTMAFAHARGVIHRDLKPLNVMVGAFGEVQVLDWGLAKVLGRASAESQPPDADGSSSPDADAPRSSEETQPGSVMGTFAYMSPEAARGEADRLDERCDVFGLGAVLCVILTGKPPFELPVEEESPVGTSQDLADAFAQLDGCGAEAELVRLAKACLAPEREERPRDAGEVAKAVTGYRAAVQERLRTAELERAAAVARAQEAQGRAEAEGRERQVAQAKAKAERRSRRLTAGLTVALLLLVGAGWMWQLREQQLAASRSRRSRNSTAASSASPAVARVRPVARPASRRFGVMAEQPWYLR